MKESVDYKVLPIREVLLHHVAIQLRFLHSSLSESAIETLTERLGAGKSNDEIIGFLENNSLLKRTGSELLEKIKSEVEMQMIGEELFHQVASYDSQLCAQITGMLLELDYGTLLSLKSDPEALRTAVHKARVEFLRFSSNDKEEETLSSATDHETEEDLGERLFACLERDYYPETASKLTGMLLEMGPARLRETLRHPHLLQEKLQLALDALQDVPVT